MIFTPDARIRLVSRHAAAPRIPMPVNRAMMQEVVAEAAQFAAGHPDEEPAALYYACTRRALLRHAGDGAPPPSRPRHRQRRSR